MKKKTYYNTSFNGYIEVSSHAIDRFRLRNPNFVGTNAEAIQKIINQVRHSKLIEINGSEEHRTHNGNVYVVKREFGKDVFGLLKEKLTVVTLKLSKIKIREGFSQDFSMDTVDYNKMIGAVS